jgi:cellulose synthase/poly-beta-1,6-N-acetylglucosamine synthase-like glycosyltransferase
VIFRAAAGSGYSVQSGKTGQIREVEDLPGGNTMYRRELLETVGPVDERLVTAEDVELHFRMRARGAKLCFSPDFLAWHHKRDAPGRFFRQIRRFAQGRVQAGRLHKGALRPLHWLVAVLPLPCMAVLAWISPALAMGVVAAGAAASILAAMVAGAGPRSSLWMPVVAALFLAAWPAGFFRELLRPTRDATGK